MFEWLFGGKKEVQRLKEEVKESFSSVKEDIGKIGEWITHLHKQDEGHQNDLNGLKEEISTIKMELAELKNAISLIDERVFKQLFKTPRKNSREQTAVYGVQTLVQTPVQTGVLDNFSITERALLTILLGTDLKMSYDDLAALTGKSRATIRGQINTIKQKSEGLIHEFIEKNGKKRLFIPDELKEKMLKKVKVRVKNAKKEEEIKENKE